jgi:hypothetical protein
MINYISTSKQFTPCIECQKTNRGGTLSLRKQIDNDFYLVCNYGCDVKEKTAAPLPNQLPPSSIEFADPGDLGVTGSKTKMFCEELGRGTRGGLRDRLEKFSKRKRYDSDIDVGSGGYIVKESTAVLGPSGWQQQ